MKPIRMVDLTGQYARLKTEIDSAINAVLSAGDFIQGKAVGEFEKQLSALHQGAHIVSCANGTDALQIAMMALDLKAGDEVIVPVHTYVATAEVIALLGLKPIFAEVNPEDFTVDPNELARLVTPRTRAIVPVHLYGQCANMEAIMKVARQHNLFVIEDNAQAIGADYIWSDGKKQKSGTIGTVGTTSFFPSKNLGAYGDGGALVCTDETLAGKARVIANHGQRKKYHHDVVGVNSRLDTLQAAILSVKLQHLDSFVAARRKVASVYDQRLSHHPMLTTPKVASWSTHVYHQYTVKVREGYRDRLRDYLQEKGIPTMIYYPVPLHLQEAYKMAAHGPGSFSITEKLSSTVLSLPIHTEMDDEQLDYICRTILAFS